MVPPTVLRSLPMRRPAAAAFPRRALCWLCWLACCRPSRLDVASHRTPRAGEWRGIASERLASPTRSRSSPLHASGHHIVPPPHRRCRHHCRAARGRGGHRPGRQPECHHCQQRGDHRHREEPVDEKRGRPGVEKPCATLRAAAPDGRRRHACDDTARSLQRGQRHARGEQAQRRRPAVVRRRVERERGTAARWWQCQPPPVALPAHAARRCST